MTTTNVTRMTRARRRNRTSLGFISSSVLVWIYAAMLFIPIYYVVVSGFKINREVFAAPFKPTFTAGFGHYTDVWNRLEMGRGLLNSTYITLASLVLTLVLAVPASYALARSTGRVAAVVERLYALGFLIPAFAALVPTLLLAIYLGMFQTREFMILYMPASAQPLTVIVLTQFMRTVPVSLFESATIDGASPLRVLRSIYIPLAMPGIATVTILNFIGFWNDFLFTLIIVGPNPAVRTLQVALPLLNSNLGITDYALIAAATAVSVLPVFIVYAVLNRRMEDALVTGAVKG